MRVKNGHTAAKLLPTADGMATVPPGGSVVIPDAVWQRWSQRADVQDAIAKGHLVPGEVVRLDPEKLRGTMVSEPAAPQPVDDDVTPTDEPLSIRMPKAKLLTAARARGLDVDDAFTKRELLQEIERYDSDPE